MNLGMCPYCNGAIEGTNSEYGLVAYHVHTIGNYDVLYAPEQPQCDAITVVYCGFETEARLRLPGIERVLTEEAIERLLLLK
jgi:hypothetical protein